MKKLIEQRHSGIPMPLIHPVLVEGVRAGVADLAEGDEVVERVVPQLSGKAHAPAVDMVDVQHVGGSALAANPTISRKNCGPIAAEIEVVLGSAPVALQVWASGVRGIDRGNRARFLAGRAAVLWAGAVWERLTAVATGFLGSFGAGPARYSKRLQVGRVRFGPVSWPTHGAHLLDRGRRLVGRQADNAVLLLVGHGSLRRLHNLYKRSCESYG